MQPLGCIAPKMQQGIGATLRLHVDLQILFDHFVEQTEQADEIAFSGPVGTDQNVQPMKFEILQFSDRFVASDGQ